VRTAVHETLKPAETYNTRASAIDSRQIRAYTALSEVSPSCQWAFAVRRPRASFQMLRYTCIICTLRLRTTNA
jgi:hypothetical protein